MTTRYNRGQWIESFTDQVAIHHLHLSLRLLYTMALSAWNKHGKQDEEPIKSAKAWSADLNRRER
jgi:hypothetical protein